MKKRKRLFSIVVVLAIIGISRDKVFESIASAWVIPSDPIPSNIEAIASTSQGTFPDRLVKENQQHMNKVLAISQEHPGAVISYSAFTGSLDPRVELAIKARMLAGKKAVFAGFVPNTADEAIAHRKMLVKFLGHEPATVVLVTSQFHGRSVRFVYEKEFPYSRIVLVLTPWQDEIDPNHIQILSRNKWLWLGANMARQTMIAWIPFGYRLYKKFNIHQPTLYSQLSVGCSFLEKAIFSSPLKAFGPQKVSMENKDTDGQVAGKVEQWMGAT